MAFTQITVSGTYKTADGTAAAGSVTFTPVVAMSNSNVVVSAPVVGQLNGFGVVSVSLAATTDPGTTPTGNTYEVVEYLNNSGGVRRYNIVVTHNAGSLDLAAIAPVVPGPPNTVYLTQAAGDARYELIGGGGGGVADGAVTNIKVASNAAINADKLADGTTNKILLATERTKLTGIATGATANSSDATLLARANHTGTQTADTITDGTTNKAYTATEKTKLAGIATAATANSSDATLLARANHTGTQAVSTVITLPERLDMLDGISSVGNVGSTLTVTPGNNNGSVKLITLTSATCTVTFNNPVDTTRVGTLEFVITQDGTGGRLITWPGSVKWAGGAPTLSTAAGSKDRVIFTTYDGGTTWYGDLIGKGYA
jgi:hypothetical protein